MRHPFSIFVEKLINDYLKNFSVCVSPFELVTDAMYTPSGNVLRLMAAYPLVSVAVALKQAWPWVEYTVIVAHDDSAP